MTTDQTLNLKFHPYTFIGNMQKAEHADVFYTRVLFRKTICMTGEAAGRVFYDKNYFTREKAAPLNLRKTLFGDGTIQGLDGEEHLHRKQMFLNLLKPESLDGLIRITRRRWRDHFQQFQFEEKIELYEELSKVLCASVCEWLGVPLDDLERRTDESQAMIMAGGGGLFAFMNGYFARRSSERWIAHIVRGLRRSEANQSDSHAASFAFFRDKKGALLSEKVVAAELINVIRPTIAVARFLCYCALALESFPKHRPRSDIEKKYFFLEVKRYYPFFPAVAAKVREDFEWQGVRFKKGVRVLYDLYGTNHDPRIWDNPSEFRPQRFADNTISNFAYVPQGGSDVENNHRCPGEWIASKLMNLALDMFCEEMMYKVPTQDLSVSMKRAPTGPKSGFLISNVRVLGFP